VETDYGGVIDLICLDDAGDVVIVELKRDRTSREITAQVLDYGSWVKELSNDRITGIAEGYLGHGKFEEAFKHRFGADLPETLNANHRLLIVGADIDASSERIIKYLSDTYGVDINAATFRYFKDEDGSEFLARVFFLEPTQVELQSRTKRSTRRRPRLTYAELDAIAQERGVADLYHHAVAGLERYLQKHTTRHSIAFASMLNESRKTVLSLIPRDSNATDGLRFQVYTPRLQTLLNLSEEQVMELLPAHRDPRPRIPPTAPDYARVEGFFVNQAEVDRFVVGLAKLRKSKAT
jgi:hypothetical protein